MESKCVNYNESMEGNCDKGISSEVSENCQIGLKHWLYAIIYRLENMKIRESIITDDEMRTIEKFSK